MSLVNCDSCPEIVNWFIFAAYDTDPEMVHPKVARYPFPMHKSCDEHLAELLKRDCTAPGTTFQWVIRKV